MAIFVAPARTGPARKPHPNASSCKSCPTPHAKRTTPWMNRSQQSTLPACRSLPNRKMAAGKTYTISEPNNAPLNSKIVDKSTNQPTSGTHIRKVVSSRWQPRFFCSSVESRSGHRRLLLSSRTPFRIFGKSAQRIRR